MAIQNHTSRQERGIEMATKKTDEHQKIEETTAMKKVEPTTLPDKELMVYMGPTIIGFATHGTVFREGLPETIENTMRQAPFLKGLFVPTTELAAAITELEQKTGIRYRLYQKVQEYAAKKGV